MKHRSIERKRLRSSGHDYSSDGLHAITITETCEGIFR